MKLAISLLLCLAFFSFEKENPMTESTSYSVDIGSYSDFQDLAIYNFENFDHDAKQQTANTFYKRVCSYDEYMLFMESLMEDTRISGNGIEKIEENLSHLDMNFFDENALIVAFLNKPTTPYYYECESITIEDDSIVVTLQVSGYGDCDAEQNTFFFLETEQFPHDLAIKIRYVYD
ncbi:MAG: hypothetical protein R3Y63_14620 [Eubacteriales bacterium]